jgi:hypothetical protein
MNMPAKIDNPFETQSRAIAQPTNAAADTDQQRAIAETQAAMVVAKKFPRDQIAAMDRILNACSRQSLAEQALYSYSKGGSDVTGPSIRLAEAIAQSWGNFQFGIRELEQRNGESTVEAFAWDIETNTRQTKVFQVPHVRHTRNGQKMLTDPRDIYELVANQGARRLRACILGVIPGDVIDSAVSQCELTLKTKVDITPDLIKNMTDKFAEFGVSKEMIEKRIQRRMDAITPALVVSLRKIFNSMKDGMSSPSDWFEAASAQPGRPAMEEMTPEKFEAERIGWQRQIDSGKKDAAGILSMAQTRYQLTEQQRTTILVMTKTENQE